LKIYCNPGGKNFLGLTLYLQEAERDLSTKWSPVVEIQYRGGRYKGRCQGGLPEGKVNSYKFIKASRAYSS